MATATLAAVLLAVTLVAQPASAAEVDGDYDRIPIIQNDRTGKCLAPVKASSANYVGLELFNCADNKLQEWAEIDLGRSSAGNQIVQFKNEETQTCIGLTKAWFGHKGHMFQCRNWKNDYSPQPPLDERINDSQKWEKVQWDVHSYKLRNMAHQDRCLAPQGNYVGSEFQIVSCGSWGTVYNLKGSVGNLCVLTVGWPTLTYDGGWKTQGEVQIEPRLFKDQCDDSAVTVSMCMKYVNLGNGSSSAFNCSQGMATDYGPFGKGSSLWTKTVPLACSAGNEVHFRVRAVSDEQGPYFGSTRRVKC